MSSKINPVNLALQDTKWVYKDQTYLIFPKGGNNRLHFCVVFQFHFIFNVDVFLKGMVILLKSDICHCGVIWQGIRECLEEVLTQLSDFILLRKTQDAFGFTKSHVDSLRRRIAESSFCGVDGVSSCQDNRFLLFLGIHFKLFRPSSAITGTSPSKWPMVYARRFVVSSILMSKSIARGSIRCAYEHRIYTAEHISCDRKEIWAHFGKSRPLIENSKQSVINHPHYRPWISRSILETFWKIPL